MPNGFREIKQPFLHVNTHGQNQNCYFCTVAALNDLTTDELVKESNEMMEDGANYGQIEVIFRSAGNYDITYFTPQNPADVQSFMNMHIKTGESVGLAYRRGDGSGHMVVLRKMFGGALECLDYQANHVTMGAPPRYLPFPPEQGIREYGVYFLVPGLGKLEGLG